jgi:NADPH:quinone reductase-like Zn-dependent oxidoreductase
MKAAFRLQYGQPEVIQVGEVPTPVINDTEALVKVHATTVNRTDAGVLTGLPYVFRFFCGLWGPNFKVLGTDFAGEVVATGTKHTTYKIGDKIWGFLDHGWPTQAEFVAISPKISTALIPQHYSMSEAVACAEGFHYAVNFINKVDLRPGQKAFVFGATGAIGSALVQQLKYHGVYVVASCGSAWLSRIKDLGVDEVFDYQQDRMENLKEKFDYFFDAVGKSDFSTSKKILKPTGIYISSELGPGAENLYLPLLTKWSSQQKVIFPMPANIPASMQLALKMAADNAYKPLLDRTYRLEEAQEAYRYMMSGQKIGNVILKLV